MIPLHIELIRNTVGVLLPLFTFYCLSNFETTQNVNYLKINTLVVFGQMVYDFSVYKYLSNDTLFHHICVCGLAYSLFFTSMNDQLHIFHPQLYTILQTEYSTFFLTFTTFLPTLMKKNDNMLVYAVHTLAQPAFICTFAYTRLYQFPIKLVFDIDYVKNVYTLFSDVDAYIYTTSVYGLYFINIYWGGILLKKCMKPVKHWTIFQQLTNEYIMKYTMIVPTIMCIYMYVSGGNWQNVYLLDIGGNAILTYTSHTYHSMLHSELITIYPKTDVDVLKNENVWIYLDDICAINLRLFLSTYVFFTIRGLNGHIFVCGMIHVVCMYLYIRYIFQLKLGGNTFSLEETKGSKSNMIYVLSGLPLLIDIGCGLWYMDYNSSQKIILTYILIILSLYLRPLYQCSHLLFHGMVCLQTYFIIQSNLSI
jgi:hypothetical protein